MFMWATLRDNDSSCWLKQPVERKRIAIVLLAVNIDSWQARKRPGPKWGMVQIASRESDCGFNGGAVMW